MPFESQYIRDHMNNTAGLFSRFLLPISVSPAYARKMLCLYDVAIEGNFVSWMAAAHMTSKSMAGSTAAHKNLHAELAENHVGILSAIAHAAGAHLEAADYLTVLPAVDGVRGMVAEMNGLKNLSLVTYLEIASAGFMPLLEKAAACLGSENFQYTNVHGATNAAMLLDSLYKEAQCEYSNPLVLVRDATQKTDALLHRIFDP